MNWPAYLYKDDDFDQVVEEERRKRISSQSVGAPKRNGATVPAGSPASISAASKTSVELLSSAAIIPTPVHWIWPEWLAEGRLQILAGAPGAGKTAIALGLAAGVSAAGRWPDGTRTQAGNVGGSKIAWRWP